MNIDFYNPLMNAEQPGWSQRGKVSSSTDLSQTQNIMNYINLLAALDQQISDVAGITRQREGQTAPNEAVSNAQANIQMSGVITSVYFAAHNKHWEKVLNSLLQVAQACYKDKSTIKQYILDDLSLSTLELTDTSLENADFGLFTSNAIKESTLFKDMKMLTQSMLQSGVATISDVIKLLKHDSIEDLENSIVAVEENRQAMSQEQSMAQNEHAAQMQREQQDFEFEKQRRDHENKIELAKIDSFKFQMDQDINDNNVPDQLELAKFKSDVALKTRKLDLEEQKIKKMSAIKDSK